MADPVDPRLLLACCTSYAFIALDQFDVSANTYQLRWVDPDTLVHRCVHGSLACVVRTMATACALLPRTGDVAS